MFEVGKKVICINNHSLGVVKKGQVFELKQIKKPFCKCGYCLFDIGLKHKEKWSVLWQTQCAVCGGTDTARSNNTFWFGSQLFAPYDDSLSEISIEELLYTITEPQKI